MSAADTDQHRPTMLMIAGFGDDTTMFDGLASTALAAQWRLVPVCLPGFGGVPALPGKTSLAALAAYMDDLARSERAQAIMGHSIASVIASLAAARPGSPLRRVISLEGNLVAQDAYFSGTAADYDDPAAFYAAFRDRLEGMAATDPIIAAFHGRLAAADPTALWQLGCDARRFSETEVPGEHLQALGDVLYLYNPANCPAESIAWLEQSDLPRALLPNASHWPTIDQPQQVAAAIAQHWPEP